MAVVIENFRIRNTVRGKATLQASFDANLGALSIKGIELLKLNADGRQFVSAPHNRYQDKQTNEWKRFNYVGFNGERGNALLAEITKLGTEEYNRRSGSMGQTPATYHRNEEPTRPAQGGYKDNRGYGQTDDYDDGMPF